jgi:integrase
MVANPTGKRRPKRSHHGDGTAPFKRTDRWRRKPWVTVVPYTDESGRRREMWLSAASKPEAEALRKRELDKLRKGIIPTHETVGQYMSAWLETVEVGPGTWPRYRQHLTERILPSFGDVALDQLKPQQVRRAVMDWSGSPQTRGGTLRLLRAGMKQAVADRRIEHDPTAGIPYPKVPSHQPRTLSGAEARRLMATVRGERFAPILVLSLGLGVRRGEALGLRTADVNWEDDHGNDGRHHGYAQARHDRVQLSGRHGDSGSHTLQPRHLADAAAVEAVVADSATEGLVGRRPVSVTIAKSLRYIAPSMRAEGEDAYRLTATKTGETREIPLPRFVADMLSERLAERDQEKRAAKVWAGNDLVFCTPVGNSVPLESLRRWYLDALERAGLPRIRWHDLRGSTVTLLYEMGVPEAIIMAIVGHRDLATTRLYKGKTPQALQAAMDRMDEALG